jgi:23S rRNA (uridine2552-2'-O)-methyltransferase
MTRRQLHDHFFKRAKQEGQVARSVYKLEEMDRRWKLLRSGDSVLDMGAAPGSWLQYAARRVGKGGRVVGIDLQPMQLEVPAWCEILQADATTFVPPKPLDVVLSDMAPATMGHHKTDSLRSAVLAEAALEVAEQHLRPGGHLVVKVLEGGEVVQLAERIRRQFRKLERLRPQATRRQSSEIFLVGLNRLGDPPNL